VAHGGNFPPALVSIGNGRRIQLVPSGLDVTTDLMTFQPFAAFSDSVSTIPKLGHAGEDGSTIVYQPYRSGGLTWLMRIEHSGGVATVFRPPMNGSLALNLSMPVVLHAVFDADRETGRNLIAADDQTMIRSTDGGDTWTEDPDLRDLVKDGGQLLFRARLDGVPPVMPLVTAISFFPGDSSQVLIGTNEGGIYYSSDHGAHFAPINGSKGATSITSFFWANLNTVYVSTFGRGLWRLRNTPTSAADGFDVLCPSCDVVSPDARRPPFDQSALVFGGEMLGVRMEKGQLREVFVTPGSSVVLTGDPKDPQLSIAITESDGKDSFEPLPKPPTDGWIAVGVVFNRDTTLTGTAFNAAELSLVPPAKSGEKGK